MFFSDYLVITLIATTCLTTTWPKMLSAPAVWSGLKGYLFYSNHESAENAAIMYSLLGCCKASDVNPRQWLPDGFAKLPLCNSNYELDLANFCHTNEKIKRLPEFPGKIQRIPRDSSRT